MFRKEPKKIYRLIIKFPSEQYSIDWERTEENKIKIERTIREWLECKFNAAYLNGEAVFNMRNALWVRYYEESFYE